MDDTDNVKKKKKTKAEMIKNDIIKKAKIGSV